MTASARHAKDTLANLLVTVEQQLASYYGFRLHASAASHLVTPAELLVHLGDSVKEHREWSARAAVWLIDAAPPSPLLEADVAAEEQAAAAEVFIGLHIADELAATLSRRNPKERLDDENLDAFCTVVEEVSHFHLILHRLAHQRGVSKLELECQGEIDKLLICALLLDQQAGDPHLIPLARRLFDTATITADDFALYEEATRYAARFWFETARTGSGELGKSVQSFLEKFYRSSWPEKLARLAQVSSAA